MSKEIEAGDWFVLPGSSEPQLALSVAAEVVTYEDERGMEVYVPLSSVKKTKDPFPKLTKMVNTPTVWAKEESPLPTFNELMRVVAEHFPDAVVEEMYGEVVIRTGWKEGRTPHDPLEKLPEE